MSSTVGSGSGDGSGNTAGVITTARALAGVEAKALSDEECLRMVDDIEAARRSLDAASAGVLAEVDRRGLCDIRYGTATATWFERRHGRSRTAVNREVRAGRRLRADLDDVFTALARGEITFERAAFIAARVNDRNADAFGAAQHALLTLSAAEPGWSRFTALVDDLARYADADGGHDPTEAKSKVSMRRSGDELVIDATLCGTDGVSFEELLETETNRMWRRIRDDRRRCPELEMPTRTQIRAQALIELTRRGATTRQDNTTACTVTEMNLVIDTDRTGEIDPILADVLNGTHPYGSGDTAGGCCSDRPGPGALIGVPVTDTAGNRLWFTPTQWELLVCNSQISETLMDHMGMPVAVRERLRLPNRAMRRALTVRDGGCVFPGCDAPPGWCDAHHVIEYANDGQTVIVNLVLLCRHHHGIVHRTGWTMHLNHPNSSHMESPHQTRPELVAALPSATMLELPRVLRVPALAFWHSRLGGVEMGPKLAAEFLGTLWLVFGGCGSAVLAANFSAANGFPVGIGFLGVALAFGLTVLSGAYAFGHVSGGHFNPAVTVGLLAAGKHEPGEVVPYIVAQVLGAIGGAGILYIVANGTDGFAIVSGEAGAFATNGFGDLSPGGYNLLAALVIEVVLTAGFLLVILGATRKGLPSGFAPIAIGLALTLIHLISIPVTNTSVNPARSTGPALFVGGENLTQLWLFWLAPILGGVLGGVVYRFVLEPAEPEVVAVADAP